MFKDKMDIFVLPILIRKTLKTPYGKLFRNIEELRKFRNKFKGKFIGKFIICVGDVVSNSLLNEGWDVNLCVYDNKTLRNIYNKEGRNLKNFKGNKFIVWNPAGMLTEQAYKVVKDALNFKYAKIFVNGEDDLFVIPCIKFCPPSTVLFYGQPNEGIVMVEVNRNIKDDIEKLSSQFYKGLCEEVRAYGHENVLSKHHTTIEVTKDATLTKRGDCIIGVNADKGICDFSEKFKEMLKNPINPSYIKIFIISNGFSEEINARGNENLILNHKHDIVIRKSKFIDDRTIAIMADKAAIDLNRKIVKVLAKGKETSIILKFIVWKEYE